MNMKTTMLALTIAILTMVVGCQQELDPNRSNVIEAVGGDGFELKILDNSETFSRAFDVNASGTVLGVREVIDETGHIFSLRFFVNVGKESFDIPKLEGFSNIEMQAISDVGDAVGFASRDIGNKDGSLIAAHWDRKTQKVTSLGCAPGDIASQAQDISADGKRISGYTTGSEPARLRPCVWERNESGDQWTCTSLPTIQDYNPYLMSSSAVISPDGQRVAACITEVIRENGTIDSSLYVWELKDGEWQRRQISEEQARLHAMNNHGRIAADLTDENGRNQPCQFDLDGTMIRLPLLPDDASGVASGVNDAGIVVGFSDDPQGPEGGPQAVVWTDGKASPLVLPEDTYFSSAFSINDRGQIAGLADFTFPGETREKATVEDDESEEPQPLVKTLGFLRTPKESRR